jgi:hypothetical protein
VLDEHPAECHKSVCTCVRCVQEIDPDCLSVCEVLRVGRDLTNVYTYIVYTRTQIVYMYMVCARARCVRGVYTAYTRTQCVQGMYTCTCIHRAQCVRGMYTYTVITCTRCVCGVYTAYTIYTYTVCTCARCVRGAYTVHS